MNKLKHLLFLSSAILFGFGSYAQTDLHAASSEAHKALRAENLNVLLVKEITGLADSANHQSAHDPHKSSYKIVHVTFNLTSSDSTARGYKTVIMRLIDPHGIDIYDPASGGGLFMLNGKETPYTYKYSGVYSGGSLKIDFLYNHPKHYKHGLHIIELYVDGYKIGEEHFVIK
ncbi:MAG: hypothetical protein H7259_05080 [Cytophagales bacterium]|nr:hypothetical protein [Cytophaga sp.]